MKAPTLIQQYLDLVDEHECDRVVELGVREGVARLCSPSPVVCPSWWSSSSPTSRRRRWSTSSNSAAWATACGRTSGFDQADRERPGSIVADELLFAVAIEGEIVADVQIDPEWVTVTWGPAPLDPAPFRLADLAPDIDRLLRGG